MKRTALTRKTGLKKKRKPARSHVFPAPQTIEERLDALCRQLVMIRDQFCCRWCGKRISGPVDGHHRVVLQTHHIRTKGAHPNLRWELDNLLLLCKGCHMFKAHGRDGETTHTWYVEHVGQATLDRLSLLARVRKGQKTDKQALLIYLQGLLAAQPPAAPTFGMGPLGKATE